MNDPHSSQSTEFGLQSCFLFDTDMLLPKPLPPGGRIAVAAISSPGIEQRFDAGVERLRELGYEVSVAPNLTERSLSYLAGDDRRRTALINDLLRSDEWDALVFARGGYGAMRILEQVDWEAVAANPRPMVGFSDLTAWMQACWLRVGLSTFHGPMVHMDFASALDPDRALWFHRALAGEAPLEWQLNDADVLSPGRAEGPLFGGCLSLMVALMGTPWDVWLDDGILFWEEVGESTYRIDRMLTQLELAGRLRRIQGVLVGRLKDCGGPVEGELEIMLRSFFEARGIPVILNAPFGHSGNNLLLPYGQRAVLDADSGILSFPQPMVAREGSPR